MVVSLKDGLKFVSVSIVCFCAVFVCTFFMNFYLDIVALRDGVSADAIMLYDAQIATAKMVCGITGGFLSVVAAIMLVFYIKLYIDGHRTALGTFKAMGYSNFRIARGFALFGASVFVGCALGFAIGWAFIPYAYEKLTVVGMPQFGATFHAWLFVCLVPAPTAVFTAIAFAYAAAALRKPALALMRGQTEKPRTVRQKDNGKDRPFLRETALASLKSKKLLAFFVAFSCFCFSAMVQMGLSMENLVSGAMGILILAIGLVLSAVSMLMAMTSLVKSNAKTIAVMKATGFDRKECFVAIFSIYIPFAATGFALGTVYQYGLLALMVNVIFDDVANMPAYGFDVPVFFITLALFVAAYSAAFALALYKASKTSMKEIMTEY